MGRLKALGAGTPRRATKPKYWRASSPKDWRRHPKNWKDAGIFLTWAVTRWRSWLV